MPNEVDTTDRPRLAQRRFSAALTSTVTDGGVDRQRTPPLRSVAEVTEPQTLGRFEVTGRLGAGAMGVVYAAYDPMLQRRVAVKLLQPRLSSASALARVYREAQALARVSHPNVVQVFGLGHHDDGVFVAMELIEGQTLAQWQYGDHGWQAIVAAYLQAAHGLAALHRAGLVHRDFKPANVMRDAEGRVRVLDLGLVRDETRNEAAPSPMDCAAVSTDASETESRAVLGTPAYMAPEQFLGDPATAASDQFSFCVALYEALHGYRPFRANSPIEIMTAIATATIADAPPHTKVPSRLTDALRRGLAREPEHRHASMEALIDALDRPSRWRDRRLHVGGVALVVALAVPPALLRADETVAYVDPIAADKSGAGAPQDAEAKAAATAATRLAERATALSVVPDLETAASVAEEAVVLARRSADPVAIGEALRARGSVSIRRGAMEEARGDFEQAHETLSVAGDNLQALKAALALVWIDLQTGDLDQAERWGRMAQSEAAAAHLQDIDLRAQLDQRLGQIAHARGDTATGITHLRAALALLRSTDNAREVATVLNDLAAMSMAQGDFDSAVADSTEAIDTLREAFGPDHPQIATAYHNLGNARQSQGQVELALAAHREGLARRETALGPKHPSVAISAYATATDLVDADRHAEAVAMLARVRTILPASHPVVAAAGLLEGGIAAKQDRLDDALVLYDRALVAMETNPGATPADVAAVRINKANVLQRLGKNTRAATEARRAIADLEATYGPEHPKITAAKDVLERAVAAGGDDGNGAVP